MAVLRKTFSFNCDLQIDQKINVKEDPRRETDSSFDSLPSGYEVLIRRNFM